MEESLHFKFHFYNQIPQSCARFPIRNNRAVQNPVSHLLQKLDRPLEQEAASAQIRPRMFGRGPGSLMHRWHVIIPSVLMRKGATLRQQTNTKRKQTGMWVIIVCDGIIVPDSACDSRQWHRVHHPPVSKPKI